MGKEVTKSSVAKDRMNRIMSENGREKFLKNYKVIKEKNVSEDTSLRFEIHNKINVRIGEGKSKEEIENELLSNEKYEKYFSFIPNWINDKFNKKDLIVKSSFNRSIGE